MFDLQKQKKLYTFLVCTINLVCIVVILVCVSEVFTLSKTEYDIVKQDWSNHAILDVKKMESSEDCPVDYQPLITYAYPGTHRGCYHNVTEKISFKTFSYCGSKGEHGKGYTEIEPTLAADFNAWQLGSELSAFKLCGLMSEKSYEEYMDEYPDGNCPSHYRSCGGPDLGHVVCIDSELCPINGMVLSEVSETLEETYSEQVIVDEQHTLYLRRDSQNLPPISEIIIGQSEAICEDKSKSLDRTDQYLLLKKPLHYLCENSDSRFKELTTINITESDLYIANDAYEFVTDGSMPDFSLNDNYTYSLYYRNFIPINIECREKFTDLLQVSAKFSVNWYIIMMLLLMIVFWISICCSRKCLDEPDNQMEYVSSLISSIISLYLLTSIYWFENETEQIISFLIANNCSDETTLANLQEVDDEKAKSLRKMTGSMLICYLVSLLPLFYQCYTKFRQSQRKKKYKQKRDVEFAKLGEDR